MDEEILHCKFVLGNNYFRYRCAAVIISEDKVLLSTKDRGFTYAAVNGAVRMGESSDKAVVREAEEITGMKLETVRPLCIVENFFSGGGSLTGLECHELETYYLLRPAERLKSFDSFNAATGEGMARLCWLPLSDLDNYEICPDVLKKLVKDPSHGFDIFINDRINERTYFVNEQDSKNDIR